MSDSRFYNLGIWGGYTQWKCNYCPFDTLDGEDIMLEHVFKAHRDKVAPVQTISMAKKAKKKHRSK